MQRRKTEDWLALYVALLLALIYACFVCWNGVPTLRHDWTWPHEHYAFLDTIIDAVSGWHSTGIGAPSPYPGGYIVGTFVNAVGLVLGPIATLALFTFVIGAAVTLGSRALAHTIGASVLQTATLEVFALFNPWVYNKTVAGHLYMLLSYGACFAILSELLRRDVRQRRLALLLLLALPQLQFFIIAMAAITIHALYHRVLVPWLTGIVIALPIWIGLIFDRTSLLHTPYTLAWEASQSVDPASAPVLTGYFANYAAHYADFQIAAVWAIVACAVLAAIAVRNRLTVLTSAAILICLIAVTGTRGILGPSYASIVLHLPESGLFRELYDLLAFVALGYCVLLASLRNSGVLRAGTIVAFAAAIVSATAWFTWPPASYWIGAKRLPAVNITTSAYTRFALYPAFQPMQFDGQGSGADPDAYARPAGVTPLNEYLAGYPVNVALSTFALNSDSRPLAALSTSLIVERPWLTTNEEALRLQMSGAPPSRTAAKLTYEPVNALPEVTMMQYPRPAGLANELGGGNIFFGDARAASSTLAPASWGTLPNFLPVRVSNAYVDERKGWIDVRFRFAAAPALGQGLGGAVTTNHDAVLSIRPALPVLVNVTGTLRSQDDRIVQRSTRGYQWVSLPADVLGLRCEGECVVAGQATFKPNVALNPGPRAFRAVPFAALTPWLVRVAVPADAPPVLRYNVAFDPNWTALAPGKAVSHIRLDATVNGWLLSHSPTPYTLYLLHWVSLLQILGELVGVAWIAWIVFRKQERAAVGGQ